MLHGVWYLVFDVQYLVFDIWWYLIFGNQIIIFLGSLVLQHNQAQTDGGLWWSLASYHQPLSIHIHLLHFLSFYSFIWIYLLWSLTSSLQPHFSYSFTSFLLDIHLFIHLFDLSFVVFNILLPSLFLFIFINIISFDYPSISFIFIIAFYRQAFCSCFQWRRKRQSRKKRQAAFKKIACKLYLKSICDKSVWQYFMNTWIM